VSSSIFAQADRIVVMDLEACDDRGSVPKHEMEIIEISAVLLEPERLSVVSLPFAIGQSGE